MELTGLKQKFEELFDKKDYTAFFAPGRINLIGEHTDYNGGNVFPCAITLGTYAIAAKNDLKQVRLYSENFPEAGAVSFNFADLDHKKADSWANHPKGILHYL